MWHPFKCGPHKEPQQVGEGVRLFGRIAALPSWGKTDLRGGHHAQRTGRGLGIKHNPGLFQNPRFYALMVHAQQV